MKTIITIFSLMLFSFVVLGQDITFEIKDSKIETIGKKDEGNSLPLQLLFKIKDFDKKEVAFRTSDDKSVCSGIFGPDKIAKQGGDNKYYSIGINEYLYVKGIKDCEKKVSPEKFSVIIENNTIDIKIKNTNNPKNQNQEEYIPGYIYYDALYLKANYKPNSNNPTVIKILIEYDIYLNNNLESNAFLSRALQEIDNREIHGGKEAVTNVIKSAGNLNVTSIADGFAKFIVKRTKQELSIAFFEKFKEKLDLYPDLKTIFPQTNRALKAIDKEIYMFEAYIQTLRESFEKDLSSLPSNLPDIIENHQEFFNEMPELKAILLSGFYFAEAIQENQNPGLMIENFPSNDLSSLDPNVKPAIQTLQLFSKSLKSKESENYWIDKSEIEQLLNDETLFKIYLGLIAQKAKIDSISYENNKSLFDIINESHTYLSDLEDYKSFIKELSFKTHSLNKRVRELNDITNDSLLFEKYYIVISKSIDLLKYAIKVENLPKFPDSLNLKEKTKTLFDIIQVSADIGIDVNRRNYSSAIVNGVYLYSTIFSDINIKKSLKGKEEDIINDSVNKYNNIKNALFKYGSFMALIVQAETSDEVASAIEAFALPTGSARIKRESKFNVSLNAYCGLFLGREIIQDLDESISENKSINNFGVSAPIGIATSIGAIRKKSKNHFSHSLFLSIVDLGALTAFRFQNESIESVPDIQLKDIISPGLFYSMGIPKCPISVNFGYQMGPLLRKVNAAENTYGQSYSRFSISVVVDIPILNFHTSSK